MVDSNFLIISSDNKSAKYFCTFLSSKSDFDNAVGEVSR